MNECKPLLAGFAAGRSSRGGGGGGEVERSCHERHHCRLRGRAVGDERCRVVRRGRERDGVLGRPGRAVQVDAIKPPLKAPVTKHFETLI